MLLEWKERSSQPPGSCTPKTGFSGFGHPFFYFSRRLPAGRPQWPHMELPSLGTQPIVPLGEPIGRRLWRGSPLLPAIGVCFLVWHIRQPPVKDPVWLAQYWRGSWLGFISWTPFKGQPQSSFDIHHGGFSQVQTLFISSRPLLDHFHPGT